MIFIDSDKYIGRQDFMAQQIKADKEYTAAALLMQVADIFVKIRERELLPQNLSATAAEILFLVDAMGEDVTPAKITRMILREPHSTAGILVRMEIHGLIKRTKNMERKNQIRVTLTAKGEKALKQAMKLEGTTGVIARLSVLQQKQLKATLTALKEAGKKELRLSTKVLPWP
jgi:DNA-binding MarR family transcriptional regulator